MDLFAEVVALTAALEAAEVDYAICGGEALAVHGAPRATRDIDLLARETDDVLLERDLDLPVHEARAGRPGGLAWRA